MRTYCIAQGTLLSTLMAFMGKESKKGWIYVHIQLIHFAIQQKLTQHCK